MDTHRILLAALRVRSEQLQQSSFGPEQVRAIGAAMGMTDAELISVVEALAEGKLIRLCWGGEVQLPSANQQANEQTGQVSAPQFSGSFHGTVIYSTGEGAQIDAQGGGHGAAYKPNGGQPEDAYGTLTAALMDLRSCIAQFQGEDAKKIQELEATIRGIVDNAPREEPNRTTLIERVSKLTGLIDEAGKLQTAATKLKPTLALIREAAEYLGSSISS